MNHTEVKERNDKIIAKFLEQGNTKGFEKEFSISNSIISRILRKAGYRRRDGRDHIPKNHNIS